MTKITKKQAILATAGIIGISGLLAVDRYLENKQHAVEQSNARPIQFLVLQSVLENDWGLAVEDTAVVYGELREILSDTAILNRFDKLAEEIVKISQLDASLKEKDIKKGGRYFEDYNDAVIDFLYKHPRSTILLSDVLDRYDEFHKFVETIGRSKESLKNFYLRVCTMPVKNSKSPTKKRLMPEYDRYKPGAYANQNFAFATKPGQKNFGAVRRTPSPTRRIG